MENMFSMSEEALWSIDIFHHDVKALVLAVKAIIAVMKGETSKAEELLMEAETILNDIEERMMETR